MCTSTFASLIRLYEGELKLPDNPVCNQCDAKVKNQLTMWHVGECFHASQIRLLFVGKPHRRSKASEIGKPNKLIDPRENVANCLRRKSWAYWSYTVKIAALVHGGEEEGWNRIAMTNLVKCTNVDGNGSADRTTPTMVHCCVNELGVISAEINLLRPTHVVFYTGAFFPKVLVDLSVDGSSHWRDKTYADHKRTCGRKNIYWWEREISTQWTDAMHVLVTSHPERKKKYDFTRMVAGWVTASSCGE